MGSQEETRRSEWEEVRSNWESGDSQLSREGENKREWSRDYIYTLKVKYYRNENYKNPHIQKEQQIRSRVGEGEGE